jgi:DNA-binding MarR family transcriptional regulator
VTIRKESGRTREQLLEELSAAVRESQVAQDMADQAVADLLGVHRTDMRCMDVLDQRGRLTAGQLAEASGLTTGAVTAMIDRMERAGYVTRVRDPEDRRRVFVELTPEAQEMGRKLYEPLMKAWPEASKRYSDHDLAVLLDFVKRGHEMNLMLAANVREELMRREAQSA